MTHNATPTNRRRSYWDAWAAMASYMDLQPMRSGFMDKYREAKAKGDEAEAEVQTSLARVIRFEQRLRETPERWAKVED